MIECNIIQYTGIRFYSAFFVVVAFFVFCVLLIFFSLFFVQFSIREINIQRKPRKLAPRNKRHPQYDISKFQAQKQIISLSGYGGSGEVNEAVCQHI